MTRLTKRVIFGAAIATALLTVVMVAWPLPRLAALVALASVAASTGWVLSRFFSWRRTLHSRPLGIVRHQRSAEEALDRYAA